MPATSSKPNLRAQLQKRTESAPWYHPDGQTESSSASQHWTSPGQHPDTCGLRKKSYVSSGFPRFTLWSAGSKSEVMWKADPGEDSCSAHDTWDTERARKKKGQAGAGDTPPPSHPSCAWHICYPWRSPLMIATTQGLTTFLSPTCKHRELLGGLSISKP